MILLKVVAFSLMGAVLLFGCKSEELGTPAQFTQVKDSIDFRRAVKIFPSFDAKDRRLKLNVKLSEQVHAYAPGEQIGKPVGLRVLEQNGWKAASEVDIPKGTKKILLSKESYVLEREFSLSVTVAGGEGRLYGELYLQICSKDACDRPRTHKFEIETDLGGDRG